MSDPGPGIPPANDPHASAGGYPAPPAAGPPPPPQGYPALPPAYGYPAPPPYDPKGPVQVTGPNDTVWAVLSHLSFFVLALIFPLIVYLTVGKDSAFVRRHSSEALNFHISLLIYSLVSLVLILVVIGIVLLIAVGIFGLVMTIVATVAAAQGRDFRYPLTIRLVT